MRHDLARAVERGAGWRARHEAALDDLASAVRRQFEAWALSPAEADIAGLMLKGVSLRDIARLRHTSETTIRQQAQGIYRKSGLSGRSRARRLLPGVAVRGAPGRGPRLDLVDRRLRSAARRGSSGPGGRCGGGPAAARGRGAARGCGRRRRRRPWCGAGCAGRTRPRSGSGSSRCQSSGSPGRATASSAGRRRAAGCAGARPSASRNSGMSRSSIRYSTVIEIGPLRGLRSTPTCGSVQRLSGSRSSSARAGSGSRSPTAPAASIARRGDEQRLRRPVAPRRRCPRASCRAPCRRRPRSDRARAPGRPPSAGSRAARWC